MKRAVWTGVLVAGLSCANSACFTTREMYTQPGATQGPGRLSNQRQGATADGREPGRPAAVTATQAKVTASARLVAEDRSAGHGQSDTAIYLTLDNRSNRPLRLGHGQLSLVGGTDGPYPARPLRMVAPTTTGRADTVDGFPAPALDGHPHDRARAAKRAARPIIEGVVVPGEHVAGMIYFAEAAADGAALRLAIQLVDVRDGARVGRIELPLPSMRPTGQTAEDAPSTDAAAAPTD